MATDRLPNHTQMETLNVHLSTIASKISDPYSSQHKLDSDLVDDTSSTHKFATAAQLSQIEINENNISSLYKVGSANILKNTAQTQMVGGVTFTMNADGSITANGTKNNNDWLYLSTGNSLKAGTYVLSSGGIIGDDKLVIVTTGNTLGSAIMTTNTATGVYERELTQDYGNLYYAIRIASGTVCNNITFKPMLCEKSVYEAINGEFQPYALSNAELTAKEQTNENNIYSLQALTGSYRVLLSATPVNGIYFGVYNFPRPQSTTPAVTLTVGIGTQGGGVVDPTKFNTNVYEWGFRVYTTEASYAGLIIQVTVS